MAAIPPPSSSTTTNSSTCHQRKRRGGTPIGKNAGLVSHATAETRKLKCTVAGAFTDGVETNIDTNGDNASATLDQGVFKCNGSSGILQEEAEWIRQSTVTSCPNVPSMHEFHIDKTQGQQRSVATDSKTGDQTFSQVTSGTPCLDTATGQTTITTEGIYLGGQAKLLERQGLSPRKLPEAISSLASRMGSSVASVNSRGPSTPR